MNRLPNLTMRRASSLYALFTLLTKPNLSFSLLSRDFITVTDISSQTHLKPCNKTHAFLLLFPNRSHPFRTNPSRNLDTQVGETPQISYRQRKIKLKADLMDAFESSQTKEQMIKAYENMEPVFDKGELGIPSLNVGLRLYRGGEDPEKVLSFATKAFNSFSTAGKLSLPFAMTLWLMGSSCYSLKRFHDSLEYLNRANEELGRLEKEEDLSVEEFRHVLHSVELELANVKGALGRIEDALGNLRKCLEIKEMIFDKNSREVGIGNHDMARACVGVLNFKEALPYCLKALEIHTSLLGNDSVEVAQDRQLLGDIYSGLEERKKALDQNRMSKKVLKEHGLCSDLLQAEVETAKMHISMGSYDEAISALKSAVRRTKRDGGDHALLLITMATALSQKNNVSDSKRCLEIACGILEKKETVFPLEVSRAYLEISSQYESMGEIETAISLLKKALSMLEKFPEEQSRASAKLGFLYLLTGKLSQAIHCLESATETLKESFGPKHSRVGHIYNQLGLAYLELDRPQKALEIFTAAKDILDESLGPHHTGSIEACQNISKVYDVMQNYSLAIEFQQQAVDAWSTRGRSVQGRFRVSKLILEHLKEKAAAESSNQVPEEAPWRGFK